MQIGQDLTILIRIPRQLVRGKILPSKCSQRQLLIDLPRELVDLTSFLFRKQLNALGRFQPNRLLDRGGRSQLPLHNIPAQGDRSKRTE